MAGRWADCWNEQSEHMSELRLGQELRLDPCHLPQKISFQGQNCILHATLTENAIIVHRETQQNKSAANTDGTVDANLTQIIRLSSYCGVSAHRLKGEKNRNLLALMLVHQDPSLSIPILISDNYDDVLLDWRLWADLYDLPMMVIDEFEELRPVRECAPLDYFLHEYVPLKTLLNGKILPTKKRFQLRLPNRRLKLRLKLLDRLILC